METFIVAYGGSIVIPGDSYDEKAMTELADLLQDNEDKKFVLIVGGGKLCRNINEKSRPYLVEANLSSAEVDVAMDEIGIAITKINARRVISSLQAFLGDDVVCGEYVDNPQIIPKTSHRVFIASGFKPNATTDYCMMRLAQQFKASKAFKISNFPVVLDVKPTEFNKLDIDSYKKLPSMTWSQMFKLVGPEFIPGGNYPLDPQSAILGRELIKSIPEFTLYIGQKSELEKMVNGQNFIGTVVRNE